MAPKHKIRFKLEKKIAELSIDTCNTCSPCTEIRLENFRHFSLVITESYLSS